MAIKTVDLRKLILCDKEEATNKIIDENGDIFYYKNKETKISKTSVTLSNKNDVEWFPAINIISTNLTNSQYIELIEWWFEKAQDNEKYCLGIEERFGMYNWLLPEIRKAHNWLIDNPHNRKRDINMYLTYWLRRVEMRSK